MAIHSPHENISEAIFHLVTAADPMPQRACDAYMIAIRGDTRSGFEVEFRALDKIFGSIRQDEVTSRLRLEDARHGAEILLEMYNSLLIKY